MRIPRVITRALLKVRGEQSIPRLLDLGLDSTGNFVTAGRSHFDAQCAWAISVGEQVTLSHDVLVIAHDASTKRLTGYTVVRPVRIGDRTYIGAGAIVLPGVTIGADCVIGAGSVVATDVPDGMVAAGNPARVLSSTAELRDRHEALRATTATVNVPPVTASAGERAAMQAALREHGLVYVR